MSITAIALLSLVLAVGFWVIMGIMIPRRSARDFDARRAYFAKPGPAPDSSYWGYAMVFADKGYLKIRLRNVGALGIPEGKILTLAVDGTDRAQFALDSAGHMKERLRFADIGGVPAQGTEISIKNDDLVVLSGVVGARASR